jgi:hypothetical protein
MPASAGKLLGFDAAAQQHGDHLDEAQINTTELGIEVCENGEDRKNLDSPRLWTVRVVILVPFGQCKSVAVS